MAPAMAWEGGGEERRLKGVRLGAREGRKGEEMGREGKGKKGEGKGSKNSVRVRTNNASLVLAAQYKPP